MTTLTILSTNEATTEARLLQEHTRTQALLHAGSRAMEDAGVACAGMGRLLEESALSTEQLAAISPDLVAWCPRYHRAKKLVAAHQGQIDLPFVKLLLPLKADEGETKAKEDRSELDELVRMATNLARQIERVEKAIPELSVYQAALIRRTLVPEVEFLKRIEAIK